MRDSDINSKKSSKGGFLGILENLARSFKNLFYIIFLSPIVFIYVLCLGIALAPGIGLVLEVWAYTSDFTPVLKYLLLGFTLASSFFSFAILLLFIVPIANLPLIPFVRSYRGAWFSLNVIPWYMHNALIYLVRYTVLDFMVPSPLGLLFYKMMGMKIGKGVVINTTNISDACLIELDDYVTIGGSAFLVAHYAMDGYLIINKLKIGKKTTIGLGATVFGGVTIGKKVTIGPNCVILPKSKISDGERIVCS